MDILCSLRRLRWPILIVLVLVISVDFVKAQQYRRQKPKKEGVAVVEVFTSENSRSAAETAEAVIELEGNLDNAAAVYPIVFHVDYLNSPLWKDSLSKLSFTERQRQYAAALRQQRLVSDQAVVNGEFVSMAVNVNVLQGRIEHVLAVPARAKISIDVERGKEYSASIAFQVQGLQRIRREYFYFHAALVEKRVIQSVTDGINIGKTITHPNVVRVFETSRFDGKTGQGTLDLAWLPSLNLENSDLICFVQDPENNKIIGAARFTLIK